MSNDHRWCIHCDRTFQDGDHRSLGTRIACPYPDCAGSVAFAWAWSRVHKLNPEYPFDPVQGVAYPLYPGCVHRRRIGDRPAQRM